MPDWNPLQKLSKTLELFELYRSEARKCRSAGAYLSGCVLLASALEAALLAMAQCFPQDVDRVARAYKAKQFSRPASEWSLSQLLTLAKKLNWLPSAGRAEDRLDPQKAGIGDLVEVMRAIRNLLHPSIYLRECPDKAINQKHLEFSFQVLDAACSSLAGTLRRAGQEVGGF